MTYSIEILKRIREYVPPTEADVMFFELGYKSLSKFLPEHTSWYQNKRGSHIYFQNRLIELSGRGTGIYTDSKNKLLTMEQLVAIVEKCKEYGWITIEENELHIPKEII